MSFSSPEPPPAPPIPQAPEAPAAPLMFGQSPQRGQGQKPKRKPFTPTFLGSEMVPTSPMGGKTLLGQ